MRKEIILCDRCKAEIHYPTRRKMYLSAVGKEGGFDLCDKCHDKLEKWFYNRKEFEENEKK